MTTGYEEYDERVKRGERPDALWHEPGSGSPRRARPPRTTKDEKRTWGEWWRGLRRGGLWGLICRPETTAVLGVLLLVMAYATIEPKLPSGVQMGWGYGDWVRQVPRVKGAVPVQTSFVVVGEDDRRVLHTDHGTFEEWELPLATRVEEIVSVTTRGAARRVGVVSDYAMVVRYWAEMIDISTGRPPQADLERDVNAAMVQDLAASGFDAAAARGVFGGGGHIQRIMLWRGIVNDSLLVVLAVVWGVSWLWLEGWR
jgi:hypothetical protein